MLPVQLWIDVLPAAQHKPVQAVHHGVPGTGAGCERDRLAPGRFHGLDVVLELGQIVTRDPDPRPHPGPHRALSPAALAHETTLPRRAGRSQNPTLWEERDDLDP